MDRILIRYGNANDDTEREINEKLRRKGGSSRIQRQTREKIHRTIKSDNMEMMTRTYAALSYVHTKTFDYN